MSGLIKSELTIFIVMTGCGMAAGLLAELFKSCASVRGYGQFGRTVMEIILFVLIGVMISEFFYYCDYSNGYRFSSNRSLVVEEVFLWYTYANGGRQ